MRNLSNPGWIKFKAVLFLLIAAAASALLLARTPEWTSAVLLVVIIWAACRAYYFAFYVLQHYVDPTFRYTGLWDLVRSRKRRPR